MSRVPRRAPFGSAERAQVWLELRRNCTLLTGAILSLTTLMLLPVLSAGKNPNPFYAGGIMIHPQLLLMTVFLGSPVFLAGALAGNLGKPDAWSKNLTIPSFLATRPMADSMPIAAKLKATGLSVAIIWVIQMAILAIGCLLPHS